MGRQEDFIVAIVPYVSSWQKFLGYGVVSAIVAQACLESAYGSSDKAKHNNYFGLKYKANRLDCYSEIFSAYSAEQLPDGTYVTIKTDWFGFADINNGVHGYYEFINIDRYKTARLCRDPRSYLQALKDAGYATSINYVDNCMAVIEKYNLTQYDEGGSQMIPDSPLAKIFIPSPNNYGYRGKPSIVTIHHMGCFPSPSAIDQCQRFAKPSRKASATYCIGNDGTIAQGLSEFYGPWTSSSKTNDMKAITIEVANSSGAPNWTVSDAALTSLVSLLADICRRNDIKALIWDPVKDHRKKGINGANMTLHKDWASTACPGPYLESLQGIIAQITNNLLAQSSFTLYGYDYSPVFDPEYYANRYADLRAAFGSDAQALWNHFVSYGMMEFRRASDEFDPVYYKAMYSDLSNTFGDDNPMYYFHYVAMGRSEGRVAHA